MGEAPERGHVHWLRMALLAALVLSCWLLLLVIAARVAVDAPLQPGQRLRHAGADFVVIAGAGAGIEGDRLLNIAAIGDQRMAVQSLTFAQPIDADAWRLLRYRWQSFPRTLELSFMFRRADAPADVQTVTLPPAGRFPAYFDLAEVPAWRGRISEIGFAEYPTAQLVPDDVAITPFALAEVELWTPSWRGSLGALATDWLAYRPWALMSISALGPDAPWPHKRSPVIALAAGLGLAAVLARAFSRHRRRGLASMLCIAVAAGWILLDLRWLWELNQRHALTRELHAGRGWVERAERVPDRQLVAVAALVRELHARAAPATRVLVAADNPYSMLRLGYHLLPLNAAPANPLQMVQAGTPGAPLWLVAYATPAWDFDVADGMLRGPGIELSARLLLEDADLQIYSIEGGAR
jgi:hypothetical protein